MSIPEEISERGQYYYEMYTQEFLNLLLMYSQEMTEQFKIKLSIDTVKSQINSTFIQLLYKIDKIFLQPQTFKNYS